MRTDAIRVARVPARLAGAPRLRPVLERWLAGRDLTRHGFAPRAIVLVRRLSARWTDVGADDPVARYASLAAVLGQARRPARGESSAEVVWFEDEAELLACMARDAASGVLSARWWWRLVLGAAASRESAVARWLEAPRDVPRAVARLDATIARSWIAGWTPREQIGLLRALARAFPIAPEVVAYVEDATLPADAGPTGATTPVAIGGGGRIATSRAERLHLLCRDLARSASAAAEPRDARRVASRRAGLEPALSPAAPASVASTPVVEAPTHRATRRGALRVDDTARRGEHAVASAAPPASTPVVERSTADERSASTETSPHPAETPPRPAPSHVMQPSAAADPVETPRSLVGLDTRHGGVLFLLNAALRLSLYGDFSRPLDRELTCTPWRFLLTAGRTWCGRAFRTDPLAAWLIRRDGDARVEPVPPDDHWQLPVPWLAPFAGMAGAWRAVWQDGRLRVVHPAGFITLEEPAIPPRSEEIVTAELARLGIVSRPPVRHVMVSGRRRAAGHPHGCPNALWPYLRARLMLALGVEGGGTRAIRRLTSAMLRLPARVEDGGDRVDVHLPLAVLPLRVRLAGLDRDPGWIPAAGCDVRFHFH
jgi:hypothetical protein